MNKTQFMTLLQLGINEFRKSQNISDDVSDDELLQSDLSDLSNFKRRPAHIDDEV